MNSRRKVIVKLESYMKLKKMSKQKLASKWGKNEYYVYRRLREMKRLIFFLTSYYVTRNIKIFLTK